MGTASNAAEIEIAKTLQAGHRLTVRWDCGGDESFVYTRLNDQELQTDYEAENDLSFLLDQYLTDRLELPGVGEFSMEGTGRIFLEGADVVIDYQSEAFSDDSWMVEMSDAQLAEMGLTRPEPPSPDAEESNNYPPDEGMSEQYTGRMVLFQV
ncbi:MAG: hypothetical protein M3Y54_08320 [Bacteroidota bacterium]|nr:hypothetical protein [Bacteroidota bacterium]